jgi:glycosyltransferase involved in cell wall biosynthesis
MSIQPRISVVMGVYNSDASLRRSLESVLGQEETTLELIVVDDGSKDGTGGVLEEYARLDNRLRVVSQPNRGLTKALVVGCNMARGEYIARQDAGDMSLPGRLKVQREALDASPDVAFVSCWTEYVGPELEILFVKKGSGVAREPTVILDGGRRWGVVDGPAHHGSVMFRKSAYTRAGGYRDAFYFGQDWDLWYRLAAIGRFQLIEQVLYRAMVEPRSISARHRKEQRAAAELSREALRLRIRGMPDDPVLETVRRIGPESGAQSKKHIAKDLYFIGECLRRRGDGRAWTYFRHAVARDPLAWKAWLRLAQMGVVGGRSSPGT